jgi:acyl-CoA thioesterase
MPALQDALALTPDGDDRFRGYADPHYEARVGMFGGWTAALMLNAVAGHADRAGVPCAMTVNYIEPVPASADVVVEVRRLGGTRSVHHWRAELTVPADGRLRAHASLVVAQRRETDEFTQPAMPSAPDPAGLAEFHPPGFVGECIELRLIEGWPAFGRMDTYSTNWVKETSGRAIDYLQLAFLADAYAPRCLFWAEDFRPVSTTTLSVYFTSTDEEIEAVGDDYILTEAIGTRGVAATSGQQARLWSRHGVLLATTEQLAWYR